MKTRKICVADELGNVKSALQNQGYQVLGLDAMSQNPDAVIVSGLDDNVMGMQDIQISAPVIDAHGMDANEVVSELNKRLGKIQ